MKRESEAIHVGCITEGMENDRVGYNATTAQYGIFSLNQNAAIGCCDCLVGAGSKGT